MHSYMHTGPMRKQAGKESGGGHTATTIADLERHGMSGPAKTIAERKEHFTARGKTRLTMYLDMAVVEHFRSRAGGRGYQTLINEALKQAIDQEKLEDVLRRVIREEAGPLQRGKAEA